MLLQPATEELEMYTPKTAIRRYAQLLMLLPITLSLACDDGAVVKTSSIALQEETADERVHEPLYFSPSAATMVEPHRQAPAGHSEVAALVRIDVVSIEEDIGHRRARFDVETPTGKRFTATVTQRLLRDGAEEVVSVEDVASGAEVSWAFGAEHAVLTAEDGSQALLEGNDDTEQFVVAAADGSQLMFDYHGMAEDSPETQELDAVLALSLLGQAPLDEDQTVALAATTAAAEEILGSPDAGWGWAKKLAKKIAKAFKAVLCHTVTRVVCTVLDEGGDAVGEICQHASCPGGVQQGAHIVGAIGSACTKLQGFVCD